MIWRRLFLTTALVGACVWCLATVQQVHSEEKAEAAEKKVCYEPVISVHDLMEFQQEHFNEIKDRIRSRKTDPEGKDEKKVKEDYNILRKHAYMLGELANVNSFQSEKKDYVDWAKEQRKLSVDLAKAAQKNDLKSIETIGREIHNTCNKCHDKYE